MSARSVGISLLVAVVALTAVASPSVAASGVQGSPKIINPFLDWQLTDEDLPSLSRWDVVILDVDQQRAAPDRVRKLRELNPSIKILAYVASEEIASARFAESADYPYGKLASRIDDVWYLRDPSGNQVFFWSGSPMLNVTDRGAVAANGQRWNEFLPQFIHDEILSSGLWDGVFLDNTFDAIRYYAKAPVDLNRDGRAESWDDADLAWRDGMKKMIGRLHALNPDAIVVGNGGQAYADILDGAFFEHFPSYNWAINWKEFRQSVAKNRAPSYTALNVNTDNEERPNDYRAMRFGLANALVGGGLFSFDKGDLNHKTLWWYDEYTTPLGTPRAAPRALAGGRGSAIVPAVWSRDFTNGIAVLNSTNASQHVPLPGEFEKIRGTQDPATNDGSIVRTVDIAAGDGLILLRRSEPAEIRGSAFVNGSFMRIYDIHGRQPQNGFFAQRDDVPSGQLVLTADLNHDGAEDVVSADRGVVSVHMAGDSTTLFRPFGASYVGKLSLAAGNTNHDDSLELVVGRDGGAPPEVRIFSRTGARLASWNAYRSGFAGGVRVAIGDLDGDGTREIVTAAGPGGGPHIRVWKTDGTEWGGGWFAFDPTDHGGVEIAAGDVDGDGKDDIVAVSGQGAIPRVRVFDGRGTLKADFPLGTKPLAAGLTVALSDLNGDGVKEILVGGLPIF